VDVPIKDCAAQDIHVWDTADYIVPAQESNAFFIVSNSLKTSGQEQRGEGWDEDPDARRSGSQRVWNCTTDDDCPRFESSRNGALTGACNATLGVSGGGGGGCDRIGRLCFENAKKK
jgi:P2X purinoceptor 4